MRIGGLRKFSIIDYPGKLAAVVFTQGCNFRCPYCFNPELVLPECYQPLIREEDVLSFLEARRGQLEGVVITGGEPTMQEDLPAFLRKIRAMKYSIKLDTNGSHPSRLQEIIRSGLVDYIAMDIKAPLPKYHLFSGADVDVERIKESITLIIVSGVEHEFRTTAVKPLISPDDLRAISGLVAWGRRYFVQAFIPQGNILDKSLLKKDCYTDEEIHQLQEQWGKEIKSEIRV